MQVNTQVHLIFHLSIYLCHTIFIMCLHCRCNRYHSSFCLAKCLVEVRASDRTHLDISRIGNWKKIIAFASFDEHDFVFPVKWFLERRGILVKVWCDPNTIQFVPYLRRFATTHHRSIAILSMYPDLVGWQSTFIKQAALQTQFNDLRIIRHDAGTFIVHGLIDLLCEIWILGHVEPLHHVDRHSISIYNP